MSFSFNVKGASKVALIDAAEAQLRDILIAQPVHEKDHDAVHAMICQYLALADEPADGAQINVNVAGSIWFGHEGKLGGVTASFQLSYIAAPKPSTIGDSDGDDGA